MKKIDENLERVITETSNSLAKHLKEITDKLSGTVLNTSKRLEESNKVIKETVEHSTKEIDGAVRKHTEKVEESIKKIDEGLERELEKSLSSLTGGLVALSGKFVEDYQPLADRLREVVRLAEKIETARLGERSNVN